MEFRTLHANEIDVRIQSIKNGRNGYYTILLLYKDARCDMNILDETVGIMNWKRSHQVINNNLFCTVSIYNSETKEWVSKEDVGVESYAEKEKGQASDSFKRACFNWGIGRELYTAPFLFINLTNDEVNNYNNKLSTNTKFQVSKIEYENKKITNLEIIDDKGNVRFSTYKKTSQPKKENKEDKKATYIMNYYVNNKEKFGSILKGVLGNRKKVTELSEEEKDNLINVIKSL